MFPLTASLIFCFLFALVSALDCSKNFNDPNYKPFSFPRNVTPPQFHTRMEITLNHRNETYFVDERFDAEKEREAFTLIAEDYDCESYWDKSVNEIDNLYLDECWSYNW